MHSAQDFDQDMVAESLQNHAGNRVEAFFRNVTQPPGGDLLEYGGRRGDKLLPDHLGVRELHLMRAALHVYAAAAQGLLASTAPWALSGGVVSA